MGDPKFSRKKYTTPSHPWERDRIREEIELIRKYGLKNKREIWKAKSILAKFRQNARRLHARCRAGDKQAEREREQLLNRLINLGLIQPGADLDDVLALTVEAVLGRRLQTLVYLKGLARTQRQARQFIVHGHTAIGDRRVTVPGYLVKKDEEPKITYYAGSKLSDESHPMRPGPEDLPIDKDKIDTSLSQAGTVTITEKE
jgi:small subunit ribosomal protein S4